MRILYGILSGFAVLGLLGGIFGAIGQSAGQLAVVVAIGSTMIVILVWLAAGQPTSFSTTPQGTDARLPRRIRIAMRVAAGPLGLVTATAFIAHCVALIRDFFGGPSSLTSAQWSNPAVMILLILYLAAGYLFAALMAWVFLRLAFMNRPLPPNTAHASAPEALPQTGV